MGLIKQPSEIASKKTISMLIYGHPGTGKTTLACSAPNPVLFDYDGGVQRMDGAFQVPTVQISSWEDTEAALMEIDREMPECQSIIIDTVGKMLEYLSASVAKENEKYKQKDGSLTQKGYMARKVKYNNFIKKILISGKNVIFVEHVREDTRGDETMMRLDLSSAAQADLMKDLDLVGYVSIVNRQRVISFANHDTYYAKNSCHLPDMIKIPNLFDEKNNVAEQNTFVGNIIGTYLRYQSEQKKKVAACEALVDKIADAVLKAQDADSLLKVMNSVAKASHVLNSLLRAKKLISDRAKELGLTYDAASNKFVTA